MTSLKIKTPILEMDWQPKDEEKVSIVNWDKITGHI